MRIKVFAVTVLTLALSVFAVATTVNAQTFRAEESAAISINDSVDGSAYLAGSTINVSGKINGDLYCAGQTITISGEVTGDILCAGQTITMTGSVAGDVRLAGQTVSVSSNVRKSASLFGQTIILGRDGKIGQDATVTGQSVTIDGSIGRDLVVASASADINATIGRDVTAYTDAFHLGKNAAIGGTVDYTSPQTLTRAKGASVAGKINYTEATEYTGRDTDAYSPFAAIVWSFMLLGSALIFALIFPRVLHGTTETSAKSAPQALLAILVGFIATIVVPVAILLLMVTILGIPLGIVLLFAWLFVLALSGVFAAYFAGRVIWRSQTNALLIMLAGSALIVILLMIPILNVLITLLCIWYGSGVILLRLKQHFVAPQYDMKKSPAKIKKVVKG